MTVDYDFPEPEREEGYPCACTDCNCSEEADRPDAVCTACFFGSHEQA